MPCYSHHLSLSLQPNAGATGVTCPKDGALTSVLLPSAQAEGSVGSNGTSGLVQMDTLKSTLASEHVSGRSGREVPRVWNQNFEIYCKGHFLQGIPRYFFFFFKGRKSFDKVTTPGCLSLNQRSSSEDFWVDHGYRFQSQFYLFRLMCGSPWCPHKLKAARMESWGH